MNLVHKYISIKMVVLMACVYTCVFQIKFLVIFFCQWFIEGLQGIQYFQCGYLIIFIDHKDKKATDNIGQLISFHWMQYFSNKQGSEIYLLSAFMGCKDIYNMTCDCNEFLQLLLFLFFYNYCGRLYNFSRDVNSSFT